MRKSQILVLLLAFGMIAGLYSMPKVLVSKGEKEPLATAASSSGNASSATHSPALAPETRSAITDLRNKFASSKEVEKKVIFADSLASLYAQATVFDSAAWYRETIAELSPSAAHWALAGDSYYDAFTFAVDNARANQFGEKARHYYQKALEKDPGRLDAKAKMAMTYVTSDNPMQGITMLREVIEKDPQNELALLNLGLLSIQSGQYDRAAERFQQILANNPANIQAQFYLGVSYAELGKAKEAKVILEQVKESTPDAFIRSAADEYLKKLK
jgi:outer membrane protein